MGEAVAETSVRSEGIRTARQWLQRGRPDRAVEVLKQVLTEEETAEGCELLGIAQSMCGNGKAARAAFQMATRLEPGRASAHYNYAVILADANELDEASTENNTALYIDPAHAGANALQQQLKRRLQERDYTSHLGFEAVGRGEDVTKATVGRWANLDCPICGAKNFMTARTCTRCGSLIPEMDDVIPVE
jgi:tetratricopeptide (TPR) repeat protein